MAVILFIIMVAVVLGAEWLVSNRRKATAGAALPRSINVEGLSLADGLFYSPGHSWAALDADGTLAIGADDMLLRLAGKLDGVGLPARSIAVSKGEPLFSLKVGGRSSSRVNLPVTVHLRSIPGAVWSAFRNRGRVQYELDAGFTLPLFVTERRFDQSLSGEVPLRTLVDAATILRASRLAGGETRGRGYSLGDIWGF